MITVYKYVIPLVDQPRLRMPRKADILSVGEQLGQLVLWARVDTDYPDVTRALRVYGTGHPAPDAQIHQFVGTVQTDGGSLVWHVFDQGDQG